MDYDSTDEKPMNAAQRLKNGISGWKKKKGLLAGCGVVVGVTGYLLVPHHSSVVASKSSISSAPIVHAIPGQDDVTPGYADSLKRNDDQNYAAAQKSVTTGTPVSAMPSVINTPESEHLPTSIDGLDDDDGAAIKRPAAPDMPSLQDKVGDHTVVTPSLGGGQRETVTVNVSAPPSEELVNSQKARIQAILAMNRFSPGMMYAPRETVAAAGTPGPAFGAPSGQGKPVAGTPVSYRSGMSGSDAGGPSASQDSFNYVAPDPGTVVTARLLGEVDSRSNGPVLATVTSGPYSGSRLIGSFATGNDGVIIKFTSMTIPYEDDDGNERAKNVTINAVAVSRDKMSTLMATSVNYHLLSKIGFQMATSFMQGLGQAIQQSGSTAMVTPGSGSFISTGKKNLTQEMLQAGGTSAGQAGQQFQSLFGNEPTTIKVAKGTEFGLLFMGNTSGAE